MLECLIIGDSIAVGTHMFMKECSSYSIGGYNTWQWNKKFSDKKLESNNVIISLGTNDHKGVKTRYELEKIRSKIKSSNVFWIMPPCNDGFCKEDINKIVQEIASKNGDIIVGTNKVQKDNIHPSWRGYQEISEKFKKDLKRY
jgi:lysophospholipase L1-like esterase